MNVIDIKDIIDYNAIMFSITIRNLEDSLKKRLRMQAAAHGHSMEEEARGILRSGLAQTKLSKKRMSLAEAIRGPLESLGFIDLPEIKRGPGREPPDFSSDDYS